MSIEEKINFYRENLDLFDETMDKYKYLLYYFVTLGIQKYICLTEKHHYLKEVKS